GGECTALSAEPPFCGEPSPAALINCSLMREHAVLAAGEEHRVELQALCCVQGHQGDDTSVCLVRLVRNLVGVGDQRYALQEGTQGGVRFRCTRREVCLRIERRRQVRFRGGCPL